MIDQHLQKVTVIGAAGKMGSGIALVLLKTMAARKVQGKLVLIDSNSDALTGLHNYLHKQMMRLAEKQGEQDPKQKADALLSLCQLTTDLSEAKGANLVFEAIIEDLDIKCSLLKQLRELCGADTLFFTNTSSIPIAVLDQQAELNHQIIGFHFYNPPAIQKLVEIITTEKTPKSLVTLSEELGKAMGKTLVHSHDVAGFIGNGHFMRDLLYACAQVEQLTNGHSQAESIYLINRVTQDYMIRPMGIFQLIDYVGIDVCQKILKVMSTHIKGAKFHADLIDQMLKQGVRGGQHADGSQKDGFLKYGEKGPIAVYDLEKKEYREFDPANWSGSCDQDLGALPDGHTPWKAAVKDPERQHKLGAYFQNLFSSDSLGAKLSQSYLGHSKQIAENLVADGVANSSDDVNAVLENGFFHAYGPVNHYF